MESVRSLIAKRHGGVYRYKALTTPAELERLARTGNLVFLHIEGQKLARKEQFLNHAALAMHFPEYFGDNWDAFEDCLTDLSWLEGEGFVLLYDHTDTLAEHAPQHFDTLVEILREAAEFWHGQGKPLLALLRGKNTIDGLPDIA